MKAKAGAGTETTWCYSLASFWLLLSLVSSSFSNRAGSPVLRQCPLLRGGPVTWTKVTSMVTLWVKQWETVALGLRSWCLLLQGSRTLNSPHTHPPWRDLLGGQLWLCRLISNATIFTNFFFLMYHLGDFAFLWNDSLELFKISMPQRIQGKPNHKCQPSLLGSNWVWPFRIWKFEVWHLPYESLILLQLLREESQQPSSSAQWLLKSTFKNV